MCKNFPCLKNQIGIEGAETMPFLLAKTFLVLDFRETSGLTHWGLTGIRKGVFEQKKITIIDHKSPSYVSDSQVYDKVVMTHRGGHCNQTKFEIFFFAQRPFSDALRAQIGHS